MMHLQSTTIERNKTWDAGAVAKFTASGADILVESRDHLPVIIPDLQSARIHDYLAPVSSETVAREVRFGLYELRIKSTTLASDIVRLVTAFLEQFGLSQARLRIEVTRSQSCPKFHCDNVNVRLVTTYLGPTTEYQVADEETIHTAPLHALVFLKGRRHPHHQNSVFHRSPEVPSGEKRLCVAIDY